MWLGVGKNGDELRFLTVYCIDNLEEKMKIRKRRFGKTDLKISEVGFGLWAAGGTSWGATEDKAIFDAIDFAIDSGINFFDTADVYGDGHSEVLLGKAMKDRRDKFIVATKIGWQGFDGENGSTAYTTVEKLVAGVESNLKRLDTDHVELIQSHINIQDPTMEIFLEGFQKLQKDGKVLAYGVSTSDFDYLKQFNHDGMTSTLQIDYSVLNRTAEDEIFPYCLENDIGVLVRGPLAMGIMTGKFDKDVKFEEGDFRSRWYENADEYEIFLNDLEKVEQVRPLLSGQTMAQFALQFVLDHEAVSAVIPGAKNVKQLNDNIQAAVLEPLSKDVMQKLEAITPVGGGRKIWPA